MTETSSRQRDGGAFTAFLMIAFAVLGLVGAFAIFAAQIPMERAVARSAALSEAIADARLPDAAAKLEALRPALDDSAARVLGPGGPDALKDRAEAERARVIASLGTEARDIGTRLRVVLAVFTAACALFGAAVISIVRRQR